LALAGENTTDRDVEAADEGISKRGASIVNEISSVVVQDMREQIVALKRLVKDYDSYLEYIMPLAYDTWQKPRQLRQRARDEGVDIKEPIERTI
jgi:hypothetical protein